MNSYEGFRIPKLNLLYSRDWISMSKRFYKHKLNPSFAGPTKESNWVIPKILLVGGYPDSANHIKLIQEAGIDTFICLNGVEKSNFYKYEETLPSENFVHFPIEDMSIGTDSEIKQLCIVIIEKLLNGNKIYLHCSGGHGRAGTVASIILHILYPALTVKQIFDYIQFSHDHRDGNYFGPTYFTSNIEDKTLADCFAEGQVPSPQTTPQRNQVERIIADFSSV